MKFENQDETISLQENYLGKVIYNIAAILFWFQIGDNIWFSWLCKSIFTCDYRIIDFVDSNYKQPIFDLINRPLPNPLFWEFPHIRYPKSSVRWPKKDSNGDFVIISFNTNLKCSTNRNRYDEWQFLLKCLCMHSKKTCRCVGNYSS